MNLGRPQGVLNGFGEVSISDSFCPASSTSFTLSLVTFCRSLSTYFRFVVSLPPLVLGIIIIVDSSFSFGSFWSFWVFPLLPLFPWSVDAGVVFPGSLLPVLIA